MKGSRNEKIAYAHITQEHVLNNTAIADYLKITKGYANNILTKLTKRGLIEKRYLSTKDNFVLSFLVPNDKTEIAEVLYHGLFRANISNRTRHILSELAYRLSPKPKKRDFYKISQEYFCLECKSLCRLPIHHETDSGLWCNCYGVQGEQTSFHEHGSFPDKWVYVNVVIEGVD
jgi:DNA-binding MarR family transcriptional regulator